MAVQKPADTAGDNAVQALFEFGYDAERPLVERGEIFPLGGHPNDASLLTLRYVVRVHPDTEVSVCGTCGKKFASDRSRTLHGDTWHAFTCECGWVAPAGTKEARAASLSRHRKTCDLIKDQKASQRQDHRNQVREIKAEEPVSVG